MSEESHDIEISIDVEIKAGVAFWVGKDQWAGMSDGEKQKMIDDRISHVAGNFANDVIRFDHVTLSAEILGPDNHEAPIDLTKVQIYDPEAT